MVLWRVSKVPETNARIVKWSDGSESLVLGDKVVDIRKKDMSQEHQVLFDFGKGETGMDAVETFDSRTFLQELSKTNQFMGDRSIICMNVLLRGMVMG